MLCCICWTPITSVPCLGHIREMANIYTVYVDMRFFNPRSLLPATSNSSVLYAAFGPLILGQHPAMAFKLFIRLALLMAFVFATALARPTSQSMPRGLPQEPEDDPFYQPPEGSENDPPGTVLRTRSIQTAFIGYIPDPVESHQILYRTTAVNGSAIATVTTVFKPWFPKHDRFVSFHVAYDSSATKCNPSYVYQWGVPPNSLISSYELLILQVYLALEYVVAVPDYEGPGRFLTWSP